MLSSQKQCSIEGFMKTSISDARKYYTKYDVENRIKKDKAHFIEFVLSLNVINKYTSSKTKAIDIGCGTGNYSVVLAKKCQEVLSVDLMDNLLEILRNKLKTEGLNNVSCLCADVLDLHNFVDEKYDLVLCMGPLYHLNNPEIRISCYNNLKKLAKDDTIFIFTYITTSAFLSNALKGKVSFNEIFQMIEKEHFYFSPFYFSSSIFMEKELVDNSFEIIEHIALDPISSFFVEAINSLSDEQYQDFIDSLLKNQNNTKLLSLSSHNMIVSKLKKEEL